VVTGKDRGIISYQYRHDITPKIGPSILNHMLCVIDDDDVVMEIPHDVCDLIFEYLGSMQFWYTVKGKRVASDRVFARTNEGDQIAIKVDRERHTLHQVTPPLWTKCTDGQWQAGISIFCVLSCVIVLDIFVVFPFIVGEMNDNGRMHDNDKWMYVVMIVIIQIITCSVSLCVNHMFIRKSPHTKESGWDGLSSWKTCHGSYDYEALAMEESA